MPTKILLIDDDEAIRESLTHLLEMIGYEVRAAATGVDGLALVDAVSPDIVITDMIMPGIGGVETIRRIRQTSASVRIIGMSGSNSGAADSIAARALAAGADLCLDKPFELAELFDALAGVSEGTREGQA